MNVKLVSITKSFIEEAELSPEELIVYIARVSNPSNQLNTETSDKLINYLIKKKHWSPFDMVNMCVEVKTSRSIAQQILRHWSIKPQEFSQRYAEAVDVELIELRRAAEKNRQSSEEVFDPEIEIDFMDSSGGNYFPSAGKASEIIADTVGYLKALYKGLLKAQVAKECAREILPLATSTTLYLNGSVRSWIHYMEQRCDEHAQLEHRRVAGKIKEIFVMVFPNVYKAITTHYGEN